MRSDGSSFSLSNASVRPQARRTVYVVRPFVLVLTSTKGCQADGAIDWKWRLSEATTLPLISLPADFETLPGV